MIAAADWRPADGLTLEPNALSSATEQELSLAMTAGPGAGKSEMLAQRADFLLRTGTCQYPKRILAISFKVDASRNLKDRVRLRCTESLASRFDSYTFHGFAKRIIDRFRVALTGDDALPPNYRIVEKKTQAGEIEFKGLLPAAIEIIKCSSIALNAVRATYSDVFLDEFQDCTTQQYTLLKLIFHGTNIRLTAVGDTKQRIMGWAGAMEGVFKTFSEDFSARPLNLYLNFRSKPELLRMQSRIVAVLDPASAINVSDIKGSGGEVQHKLYSDCVAEASGVADMVLHWSVNDGLSLGEMAVLCVNQPHFYAKALMAELNSRGIPFRNEQKLQDVSGEPLARLVVDYLLVLLGTREPEAWQRITKQLDTISHGNKGLKLSDRFSRFINDEQQSIYSAAFSAGSWDAAWESMRRFLKTINREYLTSLSHDYESHQRLDDVFRETKARIDELFVEDKDILRSLHRFSEDESVRVMTVHKSKGLEFHTVVMLGVETQTYFGDESANRCGYFVGVSRAKERLILTSVSERAKPDGANNYWRTSRTPHAEYVGYV